ncbi:MAG: class I SAM-dependent methyltransferase [Patescibacteria group bacterium]|nr:class I SAM-dependent methyltransferase [Patescibacteria group bacterium]
MRLVDAEFRAMNGPTRRMLHRWVEFPLMKLLGVKVPGRDVLEIGCGTGLGAKLLMQLKPSSYVGIDLMPEMIELARRQPGLAATEFLVMDAADMSRFPDGSKDLIVVFDVLHHMPEWRDVLKQCHRVLKAGGRLFLEEVDSTAVRVWDAMFHWDHPQAALFKRRELEDHLRAVGFVLERRLPLPPFWFYRMEKA